MPQRPAIDRPENSCWDRTGRNGMPSVVTWADYASLSFSILPDPSGPSSGRIFSYSRTKRQSLYRSHQQSRWIICDLIRPSGGDSGEGSARRRGHPRVGQINKPLKTAAEGVPVLAGLSCPSSESLLPPIDQGDLPSGLRTSQTREDPKLGFIGTGS